MNICYFQLPSILLNSCAFIAIVKHHNLQVGIVSSKHLTFFQRIIRLHLCKLLFERYCRQIRCVFLRIKMRARLFQLAEFVLFDDDEDELLLQLLPQIPFKRKKTHDIILNRNKEGVFNLLINKYLMTDDDKFVQYFRVSLTLFHNILDEISSDITTPPCNRHPIPISPAQKLCLTLRFFVWNTKNN